MSNKPKIMMGIETSCDETSVAIIDENKQILSHLILSQLIEHEEFGGVVPEIAARAHMDHIETLIKSSINEANIDFCDLDGVAATCGPGLIGGVMVGMMAGKTIAATHDIPFFAVNHLEGHALTARLSDNVAFPYLVLLVSGGHTQILVAEDVCRYTRLGTTLDDALGECFDKSAKLMGLGYPGGANVEKMAAKCSDTSQALKRFPLPTPLKGRAGCDFSFSGLKTAIRNHVEQLPEGDLNPDDIADLSYCLQIAIGKVLKDRCQNAIDIFLSQHKKDAKCPALVACGGVAANSHIRTILQDLTQTQNMDFIAPPIKLCSDNAAMIAWVGLEKLKRGLSDDLSFAARPRWPLDADAEKIRRQ